MKLGLVVHRTRPSAATTAATCLQAAAEMGIDLIGLEGGPAIRGLTTGPLDGVEGIIAIGGDGTVLESARLALSLDCPLLGINVGRLGFLAEVPADRVRETFARMVSQDYTIESRMTLAASRGRGEPVSALNDVVVGKQLGERLASITVEVDGEKFHTFRADGVVVASPTGSTGYAFSAGGPVLSPQLEAILLIAVAPHASFNRALVFPATSRLRLRAATHRPLRVSIDGRDEGHLEKDGWVDVGRGESPVRFFDLGIHAFPHFIERLPDL